MYIGRHACAVSGEDMAEPLVHEGPAMVRAVLEALCSIQTVILVVQSG